MGSGPAGSTALAQGSPNPEAAANLNQGSAELVERFLTIVPPFRGRSAAPETVLPAPADTIRDAILTEAQVEPLQPERARQLKDALVDLCGFVPDHDAALVERYEADWAGGMSANQREKAEDILARIRAARAEVITSMRDDRESPDLVGYRMSRRPRVRTFCIRAFRAEPAALDLSRDKERPILAAGE